MFTRERNVAKCRQEIVFKILNKHIYQNMLRTRKSQNIAVYGNKLQINPSKVYKTHHSLNLLP